MMLRADQVAGTVRRAPGPWTPSVQALLLHLQGEGFEGAPQPLGIDDEGHEVVAYIEGEAAYAPVPTDDEALVALAQLIRRYHDAVATFVPPPDAVWQIPGAGSIVCHNDLYGGNVILRAGRPVAFIDWEMAGPAEPLTDIASAACFWVPVATDERTAQLGLATTRRGDRLRLLCDAYGLEAGVRARVVDAICAYLVRAHELHRLWGAIERQPKWRKLWEAGSGDAINTELAWVSSHRDELERFLR
jgi:hypothetical protein